MPDTLPHAHHIYLVLVYLLGRQGVEDPESSFSCWRALAEWPPSFLVQPTTRVKPKLSALLASLLERPMPSKARTWRIGPDEARRIAECSTVHSH
jgi:hypothetical protein